jgi:hypothetical protein
MKRLNIDKKNPILELDFYDLDVIAFFLRANRKAFIEEIMEFGWSQKEATRMAKHIIETVTLQCVKKV